MDIRSEKPWHVIYRDENGRVQRSGNFNSREGVLAKATFLSRTCEVVQILDEDGRTIDVEEIGNWRARNLDIWVTA
jgi:hypothetical protein